MTPARCLLALALSLVVMLPAARAQETESLVIPYPELHSGYQTFGYRTAEWNGWLAVSHHSEYTVHLYQRTPSGWVLRQSVRGRASSFYGDALDMDDGRLVVGARNWGFPGPRPGRVHIYELDEGSGVWSLAQTLLPAGLHDLSAFGGSVAIDGDRLAVAAYAYNVPFLYAGCVLFYDHDGTEWKEVHRATMPENHPDIQIGLRRLGYALAMDGDVVVAGTLGGPGGAFVYERTDSGWGRTAYLEHPEQEINGSMFGHAVAVKGDTILVGEPRDKPIGPFGSYYPGRASVFERTGGDWIFTAELRPSDGFGGGQTGDEFGRGVGLLDEGRAVVGAPTITVPGDQTLYDGKIYIFEKGPGGWPAQETASFVSSVDDFSGFGLSLEASANMIFAAPAFLPTGHTQAAGLMVYHVDSGTPYCEVDGSKLEIIDGDGSTSPDLLLAATDCTPGATALFLASSRGFRPPMLSVSQLCIGPPLLRLHSQELVSDTGTLYQELELASPALTWLLNQGPWLSFQLWTREPGGRVRFSNASALLAD